MFILEVVLRALGTVSRLSVHDFNVQKFSSCDSPERYPTAQGTHGLERSREVFSIPVTCADLSCRTFLLQRIDMNLAAPAAAKPCSENPISRIAAGGICS